MHFLIASTCTLVFLTSSLVQAADPQLTKQIIVLQQQVTFLQKELTQLKSVVSLAPDGTTHITAQRSGLLLEGPRVLSQWGFESGQRSLEISEEVVSQTHYFDAA